jgi:hypothetical protein
MKRRVLVQAIALVVAAVFVAGLWFTEGRVSPRWLRFYSLAVVAALLAIAIWDYYLWRNPWVQRISAVPRDVRGTWRGTLTSFWVDPATQESLPPKTVYLVVRQTAFHLSAVLLTDESRSDSSLAAVTEEDGVASLDYMYLNVPDSRFEERSRIHHGSTSLTISGRPARRLKGRYWTNRDSRGELDLTDRDSRMADDFEEAAALFLA